MEYSMERRINWIRVFLILGLAIAVVSVRFLLSMVSMTSESSDVMMTILVKRGFLESFFALLLWAVIAQNTTRKDIKTLIIDLKPYITIAALFLVAGIITGALLQDTLRGLLQSLFEDMARQAEEIESIPVYQQIFFIFGNNAGVAVLCGFVPGIFSALPPWIGALISPLIMLFNGFVIGVAPAMIGMSWSHFVIAILPHGVFELPALVLASAVGIKFGLSVLKATIGFVFPPYGVSRDEAFLREVKPGWKCLKLFAVIIPLLVLAGIIEIVVSVRVTALLGM